MIIFKFKILLLGAPMVGKTSLLYRYVNNSFNEEYIASLGAQFLSKEICLGSENEGEESEVIKLIIWDIMGQSNPAYDDLRTTFYRGSDGAILIFDLTREESLKKLSEWYAQVTKMLDDELPILLIGNKLDLIKTSQHREVQKKAKELANSMQCNYIETSAKTGANVDIAFAKMALKLAKKAGHPITEDKLIQKTPKKVQQLDFVVKSRVKDYISEKGLRSSSSIFRTSILSERIRDILDNAIIRAEANDRKTVMSRDL